MQRKADAFVCVSDFSAGYFLRTLPPSRFSARHFFCNARGKRTFFRARRSARNADLTAFDAN